MNSSLPSLKSLWLNQRRKKTRTRKRTAVKIKAVQIPAPGSCGREAKTRMIQMMSLCRWHTTRSTSWAWTLTGYLAASWAGWCTSFRLESPRCVTPTQRRSRSTLRYWSRPLCGSWSNTWSLVWIRSLSHFKRKAVRLRLIMSAAAVLQILPPAAPPTPVQKTVTRDDCKVSIYCFFSYQKRVLKNC